jgi:hypothetical protein
MGFDMRLRALTAGAMLLALAACHKEAAKAPDAEADQTPQIASLDDYNLPVDKSDQITAIDAATGDASGMPRDGGAVVVAPAKAEARPAVAPVDTAPANASAPPPLIVPPPPAPAPTLTVPVGN